MANHVLLSCFNYHDNVTDNPMAILDMLYIIIYNNEHVIKLGEECDTLGLLSHVHVPLIDPLNHQFKKLTNKAKTSPSMPSKYQEIQEGKTMTDFKKLY